MGAKSIYSIENLLLTLVTDQVLGSRHLRVVLTRSPNAIIQDMPIIDDVIGDV